MKEDNMIFRNLVKIAVMAVLLAVICISAHAAGNSNGYAWSENAGWTNFNPTGGGVTVYSDHLEGYAWNENIGWIRLGTFTAGTAHTYANTSAANYGVNNNGSGTLSGYGWSENAGWIKFNPTDGGVTIDSSGIFSGYAWGENIGWIEFAGTATDSSAYKVVTKWTPLAPSNLTGTPVSQTRIDLAWTDNSNDETGFRIFRNGVELLLSPKVGADVTTFSDTGLACGRTYTYTVKATNADGDSAATTAVSITTQACPYVPSDGGGGFYTPPNQAPVADRLYVSDEKNKPIPVKLTGSDADASSWFVLLFRPLTYSAVTQPAHGTLSGTAPDLIYTPDRDFIGTDSFTYRIYDGTAYSAESVVAIIVHENSHAYVGDKYELDIFCAEYQGVRYGFRLNYAPVTADPSGLYWKMDILTSGRAYSDAKGCISVGNDLQLNVPSALFQGTMYQFTLNYAPIGSDAFGLYWKLDLSTLTTR
jgi:hypothetical protein